jgi:uncharacterized coiled-coil protein SlyX
MSDIVSGDHVRWLSYAEAGRLLGAKDDSIRRRAMRAGWKRQRGNDGRALVAVPLDILGDVAGDKTAPDKGSDIRGDVTGGKLALARQQVMTDDLLAMLARIEGHQAEALREARELAERRGEEVAELREKLARQEATVEGLQPLVVRLQADRDAVTAELASVYQEAQEARQTADRRAVELAEVRERAGRAEGEREAADRRARELAAERDQAAHQVGIMRTELATWRQGGPIARAVRAFLYRRAP